MGPRRVSGHQRGPSIPWLHEHRCLALVQQRQLQPGASLSPPSAMVEGYQEELEERLLASWYLVIRLAIGFCIS